MFFRRRKIILLYKIFKQFDFSLSDCHSSKCQDVCVQVLSTRMRDAVCVFWLVTTKQFLDRSFICQRKYQLQ